MKIATRDCVACGNSFDYPAKQKRRRFCGHKCVFAVIGDKVRAAANTPEVTKRRADTRRGGGAGKSYIKRNGRHEHRTATS